MPEDNEKILQCARDLIKAIEDAGYKFKKAGSYSKQISVWVAKDGRLDVDALGGNIVTGKL